MDRDLAAHTMSLHEPSRPSWRCAACQDEWPCGSRRRELLCEFGPSKVRLALHMAPYFEEAVGDSPRTPISVLYGRFLGWVRSGRSG